MGSAMRSIRGFARGLPVSLLEVENLSVAFGGFRALDGISFAIQPGEMFGVIGESGSGKSLTALAIAGLLPYGAEQSGTVKFGGSPAPADEKAMARLRGRRIGMVFQEPMTALNPLMRIDRQIREVLTLHGKAADADKRVAELIAEVGLEPKHALRYPHELSGGQRQRVMIAIALAAEPDLLIADEPTSALDLITQRRILDLIKEVCSKRKMALLFISHDLRAVAALCSRVMVINKGKIVESGKASAVFGHPSAEYTRMLIRAGRPRAAVLTRSPVGADLIAVRNIVRRFRQPGRSFLFAGKKFGAVDGVSFTLRAAESVAIVGPSGCGKTTLARIIAGLDHASEGEIVFDRQTYHGLDLPKALRRDISLVFQDPFGSFDPRLPVGASVAEPLNLEPELNKEQRLQRVLEAVEAVGLNAEMLARYPHEFSGGQRQRLAIARALVTRPRLVVLDEPVSALDVSLRGDVLALLNRLRSDYGLTYLVISHDLDMVTAVADRVMIMSAGKIVETGRPRDLFAAPKHPLTQELIAARLPEVV
jgi:peptide/nickel transport system ATP-binding protein